MCEVSRTSWMGPDLLRVGFHSGTWLTLTGSGSVNLFLDLHQLLMVEQDMVLTLMYSELTCSCVNDAGSLMFLFP